MISEFIFLDKEASKNEKSNYVTLKIEIRELLKDRFNRKVLGDILLDLRKDVSGDARQALINLYQDLGLDQDAYDKLKSWRWEIVSKGISHLTQMQVTQAYGFITKFINDRRSTIRKQAEIATVTLRHEGINYFLDTTKYRISEWQQLKLLEVLRNKVDFEPPRFKAWLTSNNKYVVLFALRLIKYYNQNDAQNSLLALVKHKNQLIVEEAISCIKEFHVTKALETMKLVFWKCNVTVKIAILDTTGALGSDEDIPFLMLIDKKEAHFSVKGKALAAINAIAPETIMPFDGIADTSAYRIPDDITAAVAKRHAEEHRKISGDEHIESMSTEVLSIEDKSDYDTHEMQGHANPIPEIEENFNATPKQNQNPICAEEPQLRIDFLPIVVAPTTRKGIKLPKNNSQATPAHQLQVNYEEVVFKKNTPKTASTPDLSFLPLVTQQVPNSNSSKEIKAGTTKEIDINALKIDYEVVLPPIEIVALSIDYEEVNPIAPKTKNTSENTDVEALNHNITNQEDLTLTAHVDVFELILIYEQVGQDTQNLPIDIELIDPQFIEDYEDYVPNYEYPQQNEPITMEEQEVRKFKEIIDSLIFIEKPEEQEVPIQEDKALDRFDNFLGQDQEAENKSVNDLGWSNKNNIINKSARPVIEQDDEALDLKSIPKAIFGETIFESATRQLLNDLEEFGDKREMPLLRDLLNENEYEPFKDRILLLTEKFSPRHQTIAKTRKLKTYSVFEDLFRTGDAESKLILLDEIAAIGDETELDFLNRLLSDEDYRIHEKAAEVLEKLKFKLHEAQLMEACRKVAIEPAMAHREEHSEDALENHSFTTAQDSIFELNFELSGEGLPTTLRTNRRATNKVVQQVNGTFFGQLCTFSQKIIDKLHG